MALFERAYLFKRGQLEHILTMANLELNPYPFTPRPNPDISEKLMPLRLQWHVPLHFTAKGTQYKKLYGEVLAMWVAKLASWYINGPL